MVRKAVADLSALVDDMMVVAPLAAMDGELGLATDSIRLYEAWRRGRLPAELHMYARGGHGFGLRTQLLPSDTWIDRFIEWSDAMGLAAPR